MANTALQRKNMVESQVRPSDVTDRRITGAMQDVPRERFVPETVATLAYMDEAVTVAPGRSLMAPRTFARLLQLGDVQNTDKVLIVGALSGYSAVVIAGLAGAVVALENDGSGNTVATAVLAERGSKNVTLVTGPLVAGWAASAPYDLIFIEGAVAHVPAALIDQLTPKGRVVAIEAAAGMGHAVVLTKTGAKGAETLSRRVAFDASAGALPGFDTPKVFTF